MTDATNEPTKILNIDEPRDTYIRLGCYRETGRLDRMLRVYQVALTLARGAEHDDMLVDNLVGLHDYKGGLTVTWKDNVISKLLRSYVEAAWAEEGEVLIRHEVEDDVFGDADAGIYTVMGAK